MFSVSHYEELVQKQRVGILNEIEKLNRMLNPNEYVKEKDRLQYEIKFYESILESGRIEDRKYISNTYKIVKDEENEKIYINFIKEISEE